jgi:hypothetical protein
MKAAKPISQLSMYEMKELAAMYNDIINVCEKYRHVYHLQNIVNVEKLEQQSEKLSKARDKEVNEMKTEEKRKLLAEVIEFSVTALQKW